MPSENSQLRRAAASWRAGNAAQWVTAFYAARIVGNMERGATLDLAKSISRSADTVERLAKAQIAYRHLFRQCGGDRVCRNKLRQARRRLSYLHFSAAWKALREELDPRDVYAELITASENGAGVRVLAAALEGKVVGIGKSRTPNPADMALPNGEFRLPCWDVDSPLYRQAVATGEYRVVLVPKDAETVVVRY